MVVTKLRKNNIRNEALNLFDAETHIGFGTGVTAPDEDDTDLTTPIIRIPFDEPSTKNLPLGKYDFSAILGLTEANGNDLAEMGLFDAETAGNMSVKKLLGTTVTKTTDVELSIGLRVSVNVT